MKASSKACRNCGVVGHTAFACYGKVRNKWKRGKFLRRVGPVGRQWIATRKEWISKNLPDSGTWDCTYCGKPLHLNELTLDHKKSRSRHPELRFELSNLTPACWDCNTLKGSKDLEEMEN